MDLLTAFNTYLSQSILIVPLIVGIVQAIKQTSMPDKYAPLVSIAVGIGISYLTHTVDMAWTHVVLSGIIYGLSAVGLYASTKTLTNKVVTNG